MRAKAGSDPKKIPVDRAAIYVDESPDCTPRVGSVSTWARLIKRIYEFDPLECPECGGAMKIISFIERRQTDVIERILRHCGLWLGFIRTHASPRAPPNAASPLPTAPRKFELVPDGEFLEVQFPETQAEASRELQLILDPEFL
jgi:hypothetical protein